MSLSATCRVYEMKGRFSYRFWYVIFVITALIELAGIVVWFPLGIIEPCDVKYKTDACDEIQLLYADKLQCGAKPFNGIWEPPQWYDWLACIEKVRCFKESHIDDWVSYFLFYLSEAISISLGFLYYLGM